MCVRSNVFSSAQLIAEQEFQELEKIKTIGSSYMVASGLREGCSVRQGQSWGQVQTCLTRVNKIAIRKQIDKDTIGLSKE